MKSGFPLLADSLQTLKVWQANLVRLSDFSEQNSIFSINETKTGEFWLDGSPVYRRVVFLGTLPNAVVKTVPHGINRIKDVLRCGGFAKDSATQGFINLPHIKLTGIGDCLSIEVIKDLIYLSTTTGNYSAYTGHAILEYTKS